jgi:hypothetical protein
LQQLSSGIRRDNKSVVRLYWKSSTQSKICTIVSRCFRFFQLRDRKEGDGSEGRRTKFGLKKVSPELPEMTLIVICRALVLAMSSFLRNLE